MTDKFRQIRRKTQTSFKKDPRIKVLGSEIEYPKWKEDVPMYNLPKNGRKRRPVGWRVGFTRKKSDRSVVARETSNGGKNLGFGRFWTGD